MARNYWTESESATPVYLLQEAGELDALCADRSHWQNWLQSLDFTFSTGSVIRFPGEGGALEAVVAILSKKPTPNSYVKLLQSFPAGVYQLQQQGCVQSESAYKQSLLLLTLAGYEYTLVGDEEKAPKVQWQLPKAVNFSQEQVAVEAADMVRDLVNTPANYLQAPDLFLATKALCDQHQAHLTTIQGQDLLASGYEGIYRVGQVGTEPPCLLDFSWGDESHPTVTLVGKGVCFDTGGLSLKTSRGMETMKKDMGGAAHVLGLAKMIMANNLPIRLRVLIAAVENGIGKGAMRPSDVLRYSDGTTVEVTNTDAEGRLIVADGILAACADKNPDLLIDFTTLTGAARVAVGMDISAFFTTQTDAIAPFMELSEELTDLAWPMPLYGDYKSALRSHVADMTNSANTPWGGAITAALFLQHFVPDDQQWWHFDVSAWVEGSKPGAAAMGLRTMFAWLERRFG